MTTPAFALKMRLLVRAEMGTDSWGQPILRDVSIPVQGYFYQFGTEDPDRSGDVTTETGKAIIQPLPKSARPKEWHAIEFDLLGETSRWEVLGPPEPKFSMARGGKLHHWEILVTKAAA